MEIVWLGHSAVRLRSGNVTLITDPYADSLGPSMARENADVVTVSHDHPHHSCSGAVAGDPRVLRGPGEYEVASFSISGMATRRGGQNAERQINTVFTMRAEGLTLCHLGDPESKAIPGPGEGIDRERCAVRPCWRNVHSRCRRGGRVGQPHPAQDRRAGSLSRRGTGRGARASRRVPGPDGSIGYRSTAEAERHRL